ncbi:MAG: hypothetical protein ACON5F_08165 [Jejuia sp.]
MARGATNSGRWYVISGMGAFAKRGFHVPQLITYHRDFGYAPLNNGLYPLVNEGRRKILQSQTKRKSGLNT